MIRIRLQLFLFILLCFPNILANTVKYSVKADSLGTPLLIIPLNLSQYQSAKNLIFKWNSINSANNYQFQCSLDSDFTSSKIIVDYSVSDTMVYLSSLKNKTIYYWRVRARSGFTEGNWSSVWSFTTTLLPETPILNFPKEGLLNSESNITFGWNKAPQNTDYLIQISPDSTFLNNNIIIDKSLKDTTVNFYYLSYNTVFFWRVQAFNIDNDESNWSAVRKFKTKLSPPVILHPYGGGLDTTLLFQWQGVESAEQYRLQISSDKNFDSQSIQIDKIVDSSGINISKFKFAHTYFWRVFAFNSTGDSSDWSNTSQFQIRLITPTIILPRDSLKNAGLVVDFSWAGVDSAVNYRLVISTDSNFKKIVIDTVQPLTQISISNFKYYTRYYWRLQAINRVFNFSNWTASRTFKTNIEAPSLYTTADKFVNSTDTVRYKWNKVSGAENYNLQIAFDSLFDRIDIDTITSDSIYSLSSLLPDTTFFARIKAYNKMSDTSLWSTVISFSTYPELKISNSIIADTINLSNIPRDSLAAISISNLGPNPVYFDSIFTSPDSIFKIDKNSLVLYPGDKYYLAVKINLNNISPGLITGNLFLIQSKKLGTNNTVKISVRVFIKAATAHLDSKNIDFGKVKKDSTGFGGFNIINFTGNINLWISRYEIIGKDSASFKLNYFHDTVEAFNSNWVGIVFKPMYYGDNEATLKLFTNSYPQKTFECTLKGFGAGGMVPVYNINSIKSYADTTFEAITNNNKTITFGNSGNDSLKVQIYFSKNYFVLPGFSYYNLTIKPGDSVSVKLKYRLTNFNPVNIDTMKIFTNGFGESPIVVSLKGTFNKDASLPVINKNISINNTGLDAIPKAFPEDSIIFISVNNNIKSILPNPDFRFSYFNGGDAYPTNALDNGNFNYFIPFDKANNKGLILNGELFIYDDKGKVEDSISLFSNMELRINFNHYFNPVINVPRSIPGQSADKANVKWAFFGFPFDTVYVDSIFSYFGGRNNMRDGEWMLYKYDASNKNSFSMMNLETFKSGSAYFFAQALVDTFKISKNYYGNYLSRSLYDTIMTLPGDNWKTISDPYTFDIQVEPPAMLYKYDTGKQGFELTNILKPGEGYFIEPSVNNISFKTYGPFSPVIVPSTIAQSGWYVSLKLKDKVNENSLFFSLNDSAGNEKVYKNLSIETYPSPPRIKKGLYSYIDDGSGKMYMASTGSNNDGFVWDVIVSNDLSDDNVEIYSSLSGNIPYGIKYVIYNCTEKKVIDNTGYSFAISKNEFRKFKVIVGHEDFISKTLSELKTQTPYSFNLYQNYPNPFNPSTTIQYVVPGSGSSPVNVRLKVYDILGNEVAEPVNCEQSPGVYRIEFNARNLASGVYFYRMISGKYTSTKKMLLLK